MQLYDDRQTPSLPGVSPSASKILPLYRARGYYGPSPEWEEQEFDLVPPPESVGPSASAVLPTAFSAPSGPAASASYPSKRVKVVKVNELPRKKKVIRKRKPKRVIIHDASREEERPPVSTFHEHFYSDLEGAGTIKKVKKPKRVEKIIDGDTEHIHTYSEEHIHKLVFDDAPKLTGIAGVDPSGSMSALTASNPLVPIKNAQSLFAFDNPEYGAPIAELGVAGSLGTPTHFEYAAYNPRDVTHDHVFHDHGELPPNMDITKENLGHPPKVTYNSQGLKINGATIKSRPKNKWKAVKPTRPTPSIDFSYYENMYSPSSRHRRPQRRPNQGHKYYDDGSSEYNQDNFRPIPSFKFKDKPKVKNHGFHGYGKPNGFRLEQESVAIPFSTASSLIHDVSFNPLKNSFSGLKSAAVGFSNFKDPFNSFKDIYTNNFEYDAYASSSNMYNKENDPKEQSSWPHKGKNKKKSISTQNISFGGQDHKTVVDHLADSSNTKSSSREGSLTNPSSSIQTFEEYNNQKTDESATPSMEYTITENSPAHEYYTAMALKAFDEDPMNMPEASNNNFQIVEAPSSQSTATMAPTMDAPPPRPTPTHFTMTVDMSTTAETAQKRPLRKLRSRPKPTVAQILNENIDKEAVSSEHDRREAFHRLEQEYQRSRRVVRNNKREVNPTAASQMKYGDKL